MDYLLGRRSRRPGDCPAATRRLCSGRYSCLEFCSSSLDEDSVSPRRSHYVILHRFARAVLLYATATLAKLPLEVNALETIAKRLRTACIGPDVIALDSVVIGPLT